MTTVVIKDSIKSYVIYTDYGEVLVKSTPTRKELKFLDELTRQHMGEDTSPTLEEIASQPDVAHLGTPVPSPQTPDKPLRLIIMGPDSLLNAVVTKLMRLDALWVDVAYMPDDRYSPISKAWGLSDMGQQNRLSVAMAAHTTPTVLIRDDLGGVILGSAELGKGFNGEVIVDDTTVYFNPGKEDRKFTGGRIPTGYTKTKHPYGVHMTPTVDDPGITAVQTCGVGSSWLTPWKTAEVEPEPRNSATGRALQAGGKHIELWRDGVKHPRSINRWTAYRHLRDLQAVRVK